ncbi:MAG: hypothetical protein U0Q16_19165 [Bryobacteraceae bacterium]
MQTIDFNDADFSSEPDTESLADIESTRERLGAINPSLRAVVEMRVFEGIPEIAERLGLLHQDGQPALGLRAALAPRSAGRRCGHEGVIAELTGAAAASRLQATYRLALGLCRAFALAISALNPASSIAPGAT